MAEDKQEIKILELFPSIKINKKEIRQTQDFVQKNKEIARQFTNNLFQLDSLFFELQNKKELLVDIHKNQMESLKICEQREDKLISLISNGKEAYKGDYKNYTKEIESCYQSIVSNIGMLNHYTKKIDEIDLNALDNKMEKMCEICNWISDNAPFIVENSGIDYKDKNLDYKELSENYKMILLSSADNVNTMKTIVNEINTEMDKINAKFDICQKIYKDNALKIVKDKLDFYMQENQKYIDECIQYHETQENMMQEKLVEYGHDFGEYKKKTNEVMKNYNSTYEKLRKSTNETITICNQLKKDLKLSAKEKQFDLTKETQEIDGLSKTVQDNLNKVRTNLRLDQAKYTSTLDALQISFSK